MSSHYLWTEVACISGDTGQLTMWSNLGSTKSEQQQKLTQVATSLHCSLQCRVPDNVLHQFILIDIPCLYRWEQLTFGVEGSQTLQEVDCWH